jgi:hypothetical protein
VRIQSKAGVGELGHVRATHENESRRAQPGYCSRVLLRWRPISENARAGTRDLADDIEQILDCERDACEGRKRPARAALLIDSVRLLAGRFGCDADEHARAFARRISNPLQALLDEPSRRQRSLREPARQVS